MSEIVSLQAWTKKCKQFSWYRPIARPPDRPTARLTARLTDRQSAARTTARPTARPHRLTARPTDRLIGRPCARPAAHPLDRPSGFVFGNLVFSSYMWQADSSFICGRLTRHIWGRKLKCLIQEENHIFDNDNMNNVFAHIWEATWGGMVAEGRLFVGRRSLPTDMIAGGVRGGRPPLCSAHSVPLAA